MALLVRRDVFIVGPRPEVGALTAELPSDRLGRPWLEEYVFDQGASPRLHSGRSLTPASRCDSWGRWDAAGRELVRLGRPSLASLWDDPFADYLLRSQPDVFLQSSGGMWLRDDVWAGEAHPRLLSAEWLAPGMAAWSPDGVSVAFTSTVPASWGRGTHVISVVDVRTGALERFGPWPDGQPDVLEWAPSGREIFFVEGSGDDSRLCVLDLESGTHAPLRTPPGMFGLAWRDDGQALAVAGGGGSPGISIHRADGSVQELAVGPAWTPVWTADERLLFGAPCDDPDPGDRIVALDLAGPSIAVVAEGQRLSETWWASIRISDWRSERRAATGDRWWSALVDEGRRGPAPRIPDLRDLGDEASTHIRAELDLLRFEAPALYDAHRHLLA